MIKWTLIILGMLVAITAAVLLVGSIIYMTMFVIIQTIELSSDLQDSIKKMRMKKREVEDK